MGRSHWRRRRRGRFQSCDFLRNKVQWWRRVPSAEHLFRSILPGRLVTHDRRDLREDGCGLSLSTICRENVGVLPVDGRSLHRLKQYLHEDHVSRYRLKGERGDTTRRFVIGILLLAEREAGLLIVSEAAKSKLTKSITDIQDASPGLRCESR